MIVDSSAILAVVLQEPEAERMAEAILRAPERHISAVNWLETMMVLESRSGVAASDGALLILSQLAIGTVSFDQAHMQEAHEAWRRFGKGRHSAGLNMRDCCAYATAKIEGRTLFKGGDFEKTDVAKAPW